MAPCGRSRGVTKTGQNCARQTRAFEKGIGLNPPSRPNRYAVFLRCKRCRMITKIFLAGVAVVITLIAITFAIAGGRNSTQKGIVGLTPPEIKWFTPPYRYEE